MSSIASLLVAGDEILVNAEYPANLHPDSIQQHQDLPPTLAMPSNHSFVVAGEEIPANNEVHGVTRDVARSSPREQQLTKAKDPPLPTARSSVQGRHQDP
jgi:hypothetical protein